MVEKIIKITAASKSRFKYLKCYEFLVILLLFPAIVPGESAYPFLPTCICPGVRRPVCTHGPSGNLVKYENICIAHCQASNLDGGIGVFPQAMCSNEGAGTLSNASSTQFVNSWLDEMEKEAEFYPKVYKKMAELLKLARGISSRDSSSKKMPCLCPPIERPIQYFGPSGNIVQYSNLCSVICSAEANPEFGLVLFPWRLFPLKNSQLSFEEDVTENYDYYLNTWFEHIDSEIEYYRRISSIMRSLDFNSFLGSSTGSRLLSGKTTLVAGIFCASALLSGVD